MRTIDSIAAPVPTGAGRRRNSDFAELMTEVRWPGPLDRRPARYGLRITVNAARALRHLHAVGRTGLPVREPEPLAEACARGTVADHQHARHPQR